MIVIVIVIAIVIAIVIIFDAAIGSFIGVVFCFVCILGRPNIVTLWAENSVGLQTQVISPSVVVDVTPPEAGEIICPLFVQVRQFISAGGSLTVFALNENAAMYVAHRN